MQRHYKINRFTIAAGLASIFFFNFSNQVAAQNNDYKLLHKITSSRNIQFEQFHKGLSFSVYPALLMSPASFVGVGLIKKDTALMLTGFCIAGGIVLNTALIYGLKYSIDRDRPYITHPNIQSLEIETTPAMPSGHTSSAFNVATSLTLFYPKWYIAVPAYLWASGVGYSRMYLGVHYPSDVVVGAIIGSGSAWLTHYLNKKYFKRYYKNKSVKN